MDIGRILEERMKMIDASNEMSRAVVAFCTSQVTLYKDYKIDVPEGMVADIKADFVAARAALNAAIASIVDEATS